MKLYLISNKPKAYLEVHSAFCFDRVMVIDKSIVHTDVLKNQNNGNNHEIYFYDYTCLGSNKSDPKSLSIMSVRENMLFLAINNKDYRIVEEQEYELFPSEKS